MQVAIHVSRLLKRYSQRPDLNARMPGFDVQMDLGCMWVGPLKVP